MGLLKQILRSRREEILRQNLLNRRREALSYEPETAGVHDELDRELEVMREDMLERIDACIRAVDGGTYGFCANPKCRKPIEEKRLLAMPFVRLCLTCDLLAEFEYIRQKARRRHGAGSLFD